MKLRLLIFLAVAALGLFPLLTLIGTNLRGHMARHDEVATQELANRAELNQARATAELSRLRDSLRHAAAQPGARLALADQSALGSDFLPLLQGWFGADPAVAGLQVVAPDGRKLAALRRPRAAAPLLPSAAEENIPAPPALLFRAEISSQPGQPPGWLQLELDPDALLTANPGIHWALANGEKVGRQSGGDWPEPATLGRHFAAGIPFLWQPNPRSSVAWAPLPLASAPPAQLWLGTSVDRQAGRQWKRSLINNIVGIALATMLLVFALAHFLAFKIDQLRVAIVGGVERILNNEKEVAFAWRGPAELQNLAADLTALGQRYATTGEAHRQAVEELRASEEKFRKLAASAQDAIIIMDQEGGITFWNQAARRIFGYSAAEALGRAVHSLLDLRLPEQEPGVGHFPSFAGESPASSKPPEAATLELLDRRLDGSELPIELSLSAAHIKEQWQAIWIVRDISERKQAEAEAERQRQRLIQADKMRSLGLLVSGVAHELNNPNSIALLNTPRLAKAWQQITPILEEYYQEHGDFMLAGLEYSELSPQIPRLFQEVEESSKRIKQIVKDLKEYARQEGERELALIEFNQVVETALRLTRNQLQETTANFTFTPAADLPPLRGNPQRLSQVAINLIQNSCEAVAGRENPQLSVATQYRREEGTVELIVGDNGPGMSAEVLAQITDPFFTTKRQLGGTGLGLSVSAGIVKEHRGRLSFQSNPGQGTVAVVALPVHEEQQDG